MVDRARTRRKRSTRRRYRKNAVYEVREYKGGASSYLLKCTNVVKLNGVNTVLFQPTRGHTRQ